MDNISRYISLINNRMYGDYYNLFNIIIMQVSDAHMDTRTLVTDFKKYTPYKDLEPFHEYKLSDIIQLHADIIRVINCLYATFTSKEQNIHGYSDTAHVGISITSFLQTLEYENTLLREQIGLYVNYVTFFHASQNGYLTKLYQRIEAFQRDIEEDILSNHGNPPPPPAGGVLSSMKIALHDAASASVDHSLRRPELDILLNIPVDEPTDIETMLRETEELMKTSELGLDIVDLPMSPAASGFSTTSGKTFADVSDKSSVSSMTENIVVEIMSVPVEGPVAETDKPDRIDEVVSSTYKGLVAIAAEPENLPVAVLDAEASSDVHPDDKMCTCNQDASSCCKNKTDT
jgi:hypothetical protein